jgi:hypothetical protein
MSSWPATRSLLAALMLGVQCGCAPPQSDLVDVTGSVTWQGAPLPSGMIVLKPTDTTKPPVGAKIVNGQFALRSKPGEMRVEIEAVRESPRRDPIDGARLGEMYIPARYNSQSELQAEVSSPGPNEFKFALANE